MTQSSIPLVTLDETGDPLFSGTKLWDGRSRFQQGDRVRIFGLKSKESWNDKVGEIVGELIEPSFRWPVCLLDSSNKRTKQIALLRHYNLLLDPAPFEVKTVSNHAKCSAAEWDEDDEKSKNSTCPRPGQGWIATRDIPTGALIFAEAPLLLVDNKHKNTAEYIKEVMKVINKLNYQQREQFNKLPNKEAPKKGTSLQDFERTFGLPRTPVSRETREREVFDRYLTNAVVLEYDGKEDGMEGRDLGRGYKSLKTRLQQGDEDAGRKGAELDKVALTRTARNYDVKTQNKSGVFCRLSEVNHSCHANSRWFWSKSTGKEVLLATREIKKGEQITCDYKSVNNKLFEVRKKQLRTSMKFACRCDWCNDKTRTDKLIKKFNKLYNKAFTTLNSAKNRAGSGGNLRLNDNISEETCKDILKSEEMLLNLIINKMDCDSEYLWVILHSAATLCLMLGEVQKGCRYLELSIRWFWNDRGVTAFEDYRDGLPQYSDIIRYIQSGFRQFEVYVKKKGTKAIAAPASKKKKKNKKTKNVVVDAKDSKDSKDADDVSVSTNGNGNEKEKNKQEAEKIEKIEKIEKPAKEALEDEKLGDNVVQATKSN